MPGLIAYFEWVVDRCTHRSNRQCSTTQKCTCCPLECPYNGTEPPDGQNPRVGPSNVLHGPANELLTHPREDSSPSRLASDPGLGVDVDPEESPR